MNCNIPYTLQWNLSLWKSLTEIFNFKFLYKYNYAVTIRFLYGKFSLKKFAVYSFVSGFKKGKKIGKVVLEKWF